MWGHTVLRGTGLCSGIGKMIGTVVEVAAVVMI